MKHSAIYRRWDVVVVPYPFIEGNEAKKRPALVVSTDALRDSHELYWIVMITTAKAGSLTGDIAIGDPAAIGLPDQCVVRPSRLTTLASGQIERRIGTLAPKERRAVAAALKRFLP